MGAIKKAFKAITHGIEGVAKGAVHFAKGVATLNLKEAAKGIKEMTRGAAEMARGAINLTPAAMAANTLLNGALDKILQKAEKLATKATDTIVDNLEHDLQSIKKGVVGMAKGIAHGNLGEVVNGFKDAALSATSLASNFGPGGVAKNIARMVVDTAVAMAAEKTTEAVAKKLDPNGTSVLGGMVAEMAGAAVGGAGGISRTGRGVGADVRHAGKSGANEAKQVAIDTATQQATAHLTVLLNPAQQEARLVGAMLRQAAQGVMQDALQMAMSIALQASIQKAIADMSPGNAKAFAALGSALDQLSGQGQALGKAMGALRQELSHAIESSVLKAVEKAIQSAVDGAMQIGANACAQEKQLHDLVHKAVETAVLGATGNVEKAIKDIGDKAHALGLHAADFKLGAPAQQPSLQVSFEIGVRV